MGNVSVDVSCQFCCISIYSTVLPRIRNLEIQYFSVFKNNPLTTYNVYVSQIFVEQNQKQQFPLRKKHQIFKLWT